MGDQRDQVFLPEISLALVLDADCQRSCLLNLDSSVLQGRIDRLSRAGQRHQDIVPSISDQEAQPGGARQRKRSRRKAEGHLEILTLLRVIGIRDTQRNQSPEYAGREALAGGPGDLRGVVDFGDGDFKHG